MGGIDAALAEHAFEHLFIECLGWDRFRAALTVSHGDSSVQLAGVAEKRGFAVFLSFTHRTVLANRGLLRDIQRQVRRSYHEHILIHACETPRKQVWQWAAGTADGRRVVHREHSFFSNNPPPRLLERIRGMVIGFDEEERTGLTDVLARVRVALLPDSELKLFAKGPRFIAESDRLAMAMKNGDRSAFDQFIHLHRLLVKHSSRRLVRWFNMAADDAEQTAVIGLIVAARRWEPQRGFQFSTYAHHWLLHACERYGQKWGTWFHVPANWFFPCYRLTFTHTQLIAAHGASEAEWLFDDALAAEGVSRPQWRTFCATREVEYLGDMNRAQRAKLDRDSGISVVDEVARIEVREEVARGLSCLESRQAEIIRLRYGLDGPEHTLEEIGQKLKITRERVRQIEAKAEEKLQGYFGQTSLFEDHHQSAQKFAETILEMEESTA